MNPLRSLRHRFRRWARLRSNYRYDRERFVRYASPFRDLDDAEQLLAYIWMLSHALEKSVSMPAPKPGSGQDKFAMLIDALERFVDGHGVHPELTAAVGAADAYLAFHRGTDIDLSEPEARYRTVRSTIAAAAGGGTSPGGTLELTADDVRSRARVELERFFHARHSVRQFGPDPVDRSDIEWAVRMAQRTPSVCNRQSGRVHVFENDELGAKVLACQTGNRGFGHLASHVLVVTSDLRRFLSVGERNQCWVDGGLFAMTLVWALHSRGAGTCFLNWSAEHEQDTRLRQVAGIPDHENVITLIAIGSLPDRFRVASSPRRALQDVVVFRRQED